MVSISLLNLSAGICQFGLSFVDQPLGDLDASGTITGPNVIVTKNSQLYPRGVAEQYPNMVDSNGTALPNTAHAYSECSGKGYCNRKTGTCSCFVGYEGSACQRNSCPVLNVATCNGHGVCSSAATIAHNDNENIYELWDANIYHGCLCDPGYFGPACDYKMCKVGFDPMFYDLETVNMSATSVRFSNWSIVLFSQSSEAAILGNYSIIFTDHSGKAWETIPIGYGVDCKTMVTTLESLPNKVIPMNSVRCLRWPNYNSINATDEPVLKTPNPYYGIKYTLAFPKNPGKLAQLKLNFMLDGNRPTLFTNEQNSSTLGAFVYPNGFSGESTEYFVEKCINVDVTIAASTSGYNYLSGLTSFEFRLLTKCLGDADGLASYSARGRVQGTNYTWDYGTIYNPHVVRLVDQTVSPLTDLCPGRTTDSIRGQGTLCPYPRHHPPGFFTALYYLPTLDRFIILTNPAGDFSPTTLFTVFTTTGTSQMVSESVKLYTSDTAPYSNVVYTTNTTTVMNTNGSTAFDNFYGNIDCETTTANINGAFTCVDKGSIVFFLDPYTSAYKDSISQSSAVSSTGIGLSTVGTVTSSSENSVTNLLGR